MSKILAKLIVKASIMYETMTASMSKAKQQQQSAPDLFCQQKKKFKFDYLIVF